MQHPLTHSHHTNLTTSTSTQSLNPHPNTINSRISRRILRSTHIRHTRHRQLLPKTTLHSRIRINNPRTTSRMKLRSRTIINSNNNRSHRLRQKHHRLRHTSQTRRHLHNIQINQRLKHHTIRITRRTKPRTRPLHLNPRHIITRHHTRIHRHNITKRPRNILRHSTHNPTTTNISRLNNQTKRLSKHQKISLNIHHPTNLRHHHQSRRLRHQPKQMSLTNHPINRKLKHILHRPLPNNLNNNRIIKHRLIQIMAKKNSRHLRHTNNMFSHRRHTQPITRHLHNHLLHTNISNNLRQNPLLPLTNNQISRPLRRRHINNTKRLHKMHLLRTTTTRSRQMIPNSKHMRQTLKMQTLRTRPIISKLQHNHKHITSRSISTIHTRLNITRTTIIKINNRQQQARRMTRTRIRRRHRRRRRSRRKRTTSKTIRINSIHPKAP